MDASKLSEMMKNPAMMKMAQEMLQKNPEMINSLLKNMAPKADDTDNLKDTEYSLDSKIVIKDLKTEIYNGKKGLVKDYDTERDRFQVYIAELDKSLYLKAENLEKPN